MKMRALAILLALIGSPSLVVVPTKIPDNVQARPEVKVIRVPGGGIQPQVALERDGAVHMVFLKGPDDASDIYYVRQGPRDSDFSMPIRVNSVPGSAMAVGSVRGAQIAVGRAGRVYVAWLGSNQATPRGPGNKTPMLYARMNDQGTAFEPQKNVMQFAAGLDGGGSVAADKFGHVYVVWHGNPKENGEANRQVWVARSSDDGKTFDREAPANKAPTGACGCCGLRAFSDDRGTLYILYRAALEQIHRDMYLLTSTDHGKSFTERLVSPWQLNACPMSTDYINQAGENGLIAWQTEEQVYFAKVTNANQELSPGIAPPNQGHYRKHPAVAGNTRGEVLLTWTEGTGWKRGGSIAWQVFDNTGKPTEVRGTAPDLPVWDVVAAYADPRGGFTVIY
jgi:hypothetical protein